MGSGEQPLGWFTLGSGLLLQDWTVVGSRPLGGVHSGLKAFGVVQGWLMALGVVHSRLKALRVVQGGLKTFGEGGSQ